MSWDLRLRIAIFVFVSFVLPVSIMVFVDLFTSHAADPLLCTILFASSTALLFAILDGLYLRPGAGEGRRASDRVMR